MGQAWEMSHWKGGHLIWGKGIKGKCKGPEVGMNVKWTYLRNVEVARVSEEEKCREARAEKCCG